MRLTLARSVMVSLALLSKVVATLHVVPPTVSAQERCDCRTVHAKPKANVTDQPEKVTMVADVVAAETITFWNSRMEPRVTLNVTSAPSARARGMLEVRVPQSSSPCSVSLEPRQTYRLEVSFGFHVPPWTDACHMIQRRQANGDWLHLTGPKDEYPFPMIILALIGGGLAVAAALFTAFVWLFRPREVR